MAQETSTPRTSAMMTPLWVISLFVSLTEVVTGIAVTQAEGGIQIALTTFVIAFPLLVATAFFLILWYRPFVLYPPTDFAGGADVAAYVDAMTKKVEVVRADVQAETGNLRASISLETEAFQHRLNSIELGIEQLIRSQDNVSHFLEVYEASRQANALTVASDRAAFDEHSLFRIHVVSVTHDARSELQEARAKAVAAGLTKLGYKTSHGGWGSYFYFPLWDSGHEGDAVQIVFREGNGDGAAQLQRVIAPLLPEITVETLPVAAAVAASRGFGGGKHVEASEFLPNNVDFTVAYCMRAA